MEVRLQAIIEGAVVTATVHSAPSGHMKDIHELKVGWNVILFDRSLMIVNVLSMHSKPHTFDDLGSTH